MAVDTTGVKTISWTRSLGTTVTHYRVDYNQDEAGWVEIEGSPIYRNGEQWNYQCVTPVLDDLSSYAFRVVALDVADNECETPTAIAAELMVRTPDTVEWSMTATNNTITIDEE